MQMLFRCEISQFKIMPQSYFVHKVEPAVSHPKCKDSVVTQLGWGQALKWSGVKKKIGEQNEPDAIFSVLGNAADHTVFAL